MTKYAVEVWESFKKIVMIEADSEKEAERFARRDWHDREIELDADDFWNSEFICIGEYEE